MDFNIKKKLFERMEYLNPEFKNNTGFLNKNEQIIINNIFSLNENSNNWWEKFIQYGKKGLLTAGIILSIAFSSQAQNEHKTDDVIKIGTQMINKKDADNVYNYIIGSSLLMSDNFKKKMDMNGVKSSSDIIYHFMKLRNGEQPNPLPLNVQKLANLLKKMYDKDKNNPQKIQYVINKGKNLKNFTYTY